MKDFKNKIQIKMDNHHTKRMYAHKEIYSDWIQKYYKVKLYKLKH